MLHMRAALLGAALCWLAATGPAGATLFCNVLESPDGFVALRAGPSAGARLVARMKAGDEVQILLGRKGNWEEVYHWRGLDRHNDETRTNKRHGWVNTRYIDDTCG
jgi:hypothetical protein